jgi:hypothetical protein
MSIVKIIKITHCQGILKSYYFRDELDWTLFGPLKKFIHPLPQLLNGKPVKH